ncbi:hypothetical protein BO78DRAFT_396887, partial [Aspergillus sclerotiicarbonarius CBS 121057]
MSQNPNHEGIFEKIFGHHHSHNQNKNQNNLQDDDDTGGSERQYSTQQSTAAQQGTQPSHHGEESEMDKLKDYLHEDEELEREGQTYGGL